MNQQLWLSLFSKHMHTILVFLAHKFHFIFILIIRYNPHYLNIVYLHMTIYKILLYVIWNQPIFFSCIVLCLPNVMLCFPNYLNIRMYIVYFVHFPIWNESSPQKEKSQNNHWITVNSSTNSITSILRLFFVTIMSCKEPRVTTQCFLFSFININYSVSDF